MPNPGYSIKDLYPDFTNVQSTTDNTVPSSDQQAVYIKADADSPVLLTQKDKGHTVMAIVGVIALLFAFGLIK
jgi:hypothetical protein